MKNKEKLLKRIEQLKDELNKAESELNQVPFWGWFYGGVSPVALERVISIKDGRCKIDIENSGYEGHTFGTWDKRYFTRHATPEEIEKHLIELAKKKYKKGDTVINTNGIEVTFGKTILSDTRYDADVDRLVYKGIYVYEQGKWAEIVPSLPSWEDLNVGLELDFSGKKNHYDKLVILAKLLAVADYVNEGWGPELNNHHQEKYIILYDDDSKILDYSICYAISFGAPTFKSQEAAQKAIEIFRHNGSEQELIDFFR